MCRQIQKNGRKLLRLKYNVSMTIQSKTTERLKLLLNFANKAVSRRKADQPLIIHSDRGSQYVANEYLKATSKMKNSYSKKAYPWDNACIESFHALIKREWLNRFRIKDYLQADSLIFEYIEAFYNTTRIHSHCDYNAIVREIAKQFHPSSVSTKREICSPLVKVWTPPLTASC